MKKLSSSSACFISFLFFPVLFLFIRSRKNFGLIWLLFIALVFTGCFLNFYKTNTKNGLDESMLSALKNKNKYFVVHLKNEKVMALKNISINNNLIDADTEPLTINHTKYLNPFANRSLRYKKKDDAVLSEIHLYALNESLDDKPHLSIPVSSIKRVDIYEKDISRTLINHVLSYIGIAFVLVLIGVALGAANNTPPPAATSADCNCPKVYTYQDGQYQFKSGVFSGAVYSSLERSDYLPLDNLKDEHGKFLLRLMNNQQEEQFVNQLQLVKVAHSPTTHILLDRFGKVHDYRELTTLKSTSLNKDQSAQLLKNRDGIAYIFNEKADPKSNFGNVILTFEKPANAKQAKLIVNAKNSMWAGYLYEEFSAMFGDKSQKYIAKEDKAKKQKIERWQKEQALPLMVYVETDKGWKLADYFPTTGNTAGRDMIMSLDIPDNKQTSLRIKIESAYMFWELDYAALDFSDDHNYKPETINVSTAVKSNSKANEVNNLLNKDYQYTKLLQDEFISIDFEKPSQITQQADSYFLVSTGYYHSLKNYMGKPDLVKLNQFRKKGAFNKFSENRFIEAQKMMANGTALQNPSLK